MHMQNTVNLHTCTAHIRHACIPTAHKYTQRTHMHLFSIPRQAWRLASPPVKGSSQEVTVSAGPRSAPVQRLHPECISSPALGLAGGAAAWKCSEAKGGRPHGGRQTPSGPLGLGHTEDMWAEFNPFAKSMD